MRRRWPWGRKSRPRVAAVGSFHVANFGDVLYPLLLAHELRKRLGDIDVEVFSSEPRARSQWPYEVRNLRALLDDLSGFDLLLLGGGEILHFMPGVITPDDPELPDPAALWIDVPLAAHAARIPVAWNAPSARWDTGPLDRMPDWGRQPAAAAIRAASYVAVRDEASAARLTAIADDVSVEIAPDSAFGIATLLGGPAATEAEALLGTAAVGDRYAIVQPSPWLSGECARLAQLAARLRDDGIQVLELPIGPVHGDSPGALGAEIGSAPPGPWPHPIVIAELIAGAELTVGPSLHLGIVSVASGVAHLRPRLEPADGHALASPKYGALDGLGAIAMWTVGEPGPLPAPPSPGRDRGRESQLAALARHWDSICALVG